MQLPIHDHTTNRMHVKFKGKASAEDIEFQKIIREMVHDETKNKGLLQLEYIEVSQNVIICRDDTNNGIVRYGTISLVSWLSNCLNRSTCEDYLLKKKKLSNLKARGKVKKEKKYYS